MTSVRCVRRSRVCVCVCVDSLVLFFLLTRPPNLRSRISSWKREGEARLRDPFLPSQPRILTCAADDGPCFASFLFFSANASDISNARTPRSGRRRSRARRQAGRNVLNVPRIERSRSARSERIDTPPRYPRRPFLAPRTRKAVDETFSNSGPSSRLTCFRRRATDSSAAIATRSNDAGRSER